MARIPELKPEQLSDAQRKLAEGLGVTRGGGLSTNGPWGLLLRNPELCERAGHFGTMLRDATSVPKRLSEIAIAVSARYWSADFEWWAHAPQALRAGVSAEVLESIRRRQRPVFDRKDEEAAYDFVTELQEKKRVGDAVYQRLVEHLGAQGAIELTTITGFYSTIAMLLIAFEVDMPAGVERAFAA
ncbi:MAG: carboxymuconolactone decarboxylase family protein [Betaproteobacteria bacterium]|nr:carboxymuconolactone decarboxylase family protein [Betaproteobacteria bacterium]